MAFSAAAFAQETEIAQAPGQPPAADAVAVRTGDFPALPPSRVCKAGDIVGVWRLLQVYEDPSSTEAVAFAAQSIQYIYFGKDTVFKDYRNAHNTLSDEAIRRTLMEREESLRQYVLKEGVLFFYTDSVLAGSLACFIVANPRGDFSVGQMLLMPQAPADGSMPAIRMAKLYEKSWSPPSGKRRIMRRHRRS